jgi:hypothetical protein
MDQTQLQQHIAEYYSKLPAGAQALFASMKWMDTLQAICKKYTLSNDQIQTLGTETSLVLLGIIPIGQYIENLMKEIVLPVDSLTKMLGEIEDTVLKEVRPELEQAYKANIQSIEAENKKAEVTSDPKFASLPAELQSAIAQSDYQKKLYEIATSYKLQVEKMGKLEDLTVLFIKGETSSSQYENSLALELDLEASQARELATKVNTSILQNIRDNMKAIDAQRAETESLVSIKNMPEGDSAPVPPYAMPTIDQSKVDPKPIAIPKMNIDNLSAPQKPEQVAVQESHAQIYKDGGIEILDDSGKGVEPEIRIPKSGLDAVKQKLDGITATPTTVIDHSLSKNIEDKLPKPETAPAPQATPTPSTGSAPHDPYHEAIDN